MFAKHKLGAACLVAYGSIQAGAIVPEVNELYADVAEWLESNDWAELPDDFGVTPATDEELTAQRQQAYADTTTGSDRLFIEYQALLAKGSDGAEAAKDAWLARREEIKQEYPLNGQS